MRYPNFDEEKKLWRKGYKRVFGLDESGRGSLAGPVLAAAVSIKLKTKNQKLKTHIKNKKINNLTIEQFNNLGIRDSKKLTALQREKLYRMLTNSNLIEWGIGRVSEKVIDKINILEATKLAMKKAIKKLTQKLKNQKTKKHNLDFLIVDGNFKINLAVPQKSIIKADQKVFSCATASILAKVYRDRIMGRYHKKYPQYGFDKHKGYPTKYHLKMLKKYGPCKIHRKSFKPVKNMLK